MLLPLLALFACNPKEPAETGSVPEPGPLMAGYADARIPCPLGIGTAGYSPLSGVDSDSPFAEFFPATTRIHGHPSIRVTVISRGEGFELVFVRIDTIGVFQQLHQKMVEDLQVRLGRDLTDSLIFGGTHTHSGPGRVVDAGGLLGLIADNFFPEYYVNLMDTLADTVEAAYADLQPARVGHGMASSSSGHNDRRCEDGSHENPSVPVIAIERNGVVDGIVFSYAVHGTLMDISELTLSRDSMGGIEHGIEGAFDHPVHVQGYDSWGADMSPGDPEVTAQEGAAMPSSFDRMEKLGVALGEAVATTVDGIVFQDEPPIRSQTYRTPIDRDVLGYGSGEFPYDYGAVYCEGESDCEDPSTTVEGLDSMCLPFSEDAPAPTQTLWTLAQLGDLHLVTFTGEPGTLLAEKVITGFQAHEGVGDVMFLGYTQDYLGYSILEDDWWQGGYEASGALWGPLQGEHLSDETLRSMDDFFGVADWGAQPDPTPPFQDPTFDAYAPEEAVGPGQVVTDVAATVGPTDTVTFSVTGLDPWLGAPRATLVDATGQEVTRPSGLPFDSDGYGFWVDLTTDPTYDAVLVSPTRTFTWTFSMPVRHLYDVGWPVLQGTYRVRVTLPDGTEVESGELVVEG